MRLRKHLVVEITIEEKLPNPDWQSGKILL
jgi:hypothetical protein